MISLKFPLQHISGQSSPIRKPKEIAYFSYDNQHTFRLDDSSIRTYYPPQLGQSLSAGYENFIKHDDSIDEHLDSLLMALMDKEKKSGKIFAADIITWRGMLTKIMCLPYDRRSGFEMNVIKFKDTIFIEENHAYKMSTRRSTNPREDLMSFWGYKFESLATLSLSWDDCERDVIENRPSETVNNKSQFCSIVKTGFGSVRLILGGEVDAVWDRRPENHEDVSDAINYVELKTSKEITNEKEEVTFERKLLRFWSQSFLLGVTRIIVGFRNNEGVLTHLQEFDTQNIPSIVKRSGRNIWEGKLSIDFTGAFLKWLVDSITEDAVWRIRHQENSDTVALFQTGDSSFLPKFFTQWRESMT